MRYFIDTEFIESGPGYPIILLSLGVVAEDGRELYCINSDARESYHFASEWVRTNVLPKLELGDGRDYGLPLRELGETVRGFCGEKPEFWGYYCAYDWVVFCQMFGAMVDLPDGWPMYCYDIRQYADSLGCPVLPTQMEEEHNALGDARWNRRAWKFLAGIAREILAGVEVGRG